MSDTPTPGFPPEYDEAAIVRIWLRAKLKEAES